MIVNRLGYWRKRAKLTYAELAARVGSTVSTVRRMEEGKVPLIHELLPDVANVYGVPWHELVYDSAGRPNPDTLAGLEESAASFEPPPGHDLADRKLAAHEAYFTVKTNDLEAIGLLSGTILTIDMSPAAIRNVMTGDVVVAQIYGPGLVDAVTVTRQFIAPELLIGNSRRRDVPNIHMDKVDCAIKGIARKQWSEVATR